MDAGDECGTGWRVMGAQSRGSAGRCTLTVCLPPTPTHPPVSLSVWEAFLLTGEVLHATSLLTDVSREGVGMEE